MVANGVGGGHRNPKFHSSIHYSTQGTLVSLTGESWASDQPLPPQFCCISASPGSHKVLSIEYKTLDPPPKKENLVPADQLGCWLLLVAKQPVPANTHEQFVNSLSINWLPDHQQQERTEPYQQAFEYLCSKKLIMKVWEMQEAYYILGITELDVSQQAIFFTVINNTNLSEKVNKHIHIQCN